MGVSTQSTWGVTLKCSKSHHEAFDLVLPCCHLLRPAYSPLWWSNHPCRLCQPCSHLSPEERLMRRKLKNRVAAQTARDKKKAQTDEMEIMIQQLKEDRQKMLEENSRLQAVNTQLQLDNASLQQENTELKTKLGMGT